MFHDRRGEAVREALARVRTGETPEEVESETLACVEDRSRRDRAGVRLAGDAQHDPTARALADTAACLANRAGGAVIVGLRPHQGGPEAFVGTRLDEAWVRHRVWELADPALTCEVQAVVDEPSGTRLLVLLVPQALTAHRVAGRYTHRVGRACVDMSAADHARFTERWVDWSAEPTSYDVRCVDPAAVNVARLLLRATGEPGRAALAARPDPELLRALGVLDTAGRLTRAGALLFVAEPTAPARLDYRRRARPGGEARRRIDAPGQPLLVEFHTVETVFGTENTRPTAVRHGARGQAETIPAAAAREAVVNAIMHRDWQRAGPVTVEHTGDQLVVISPGGFPEGVSAENVLTTTSRPRNRHLADVLRSLRLAEREAIGVDRMYREMILVGHPPPDLSEVHDAVRCVLVGGDPVEPVRDLTAALSPEAREDVDIALIVHHLLDAPRVTTERLAPVLQKSRLEAADALRRAAAERLPGDAPLLVATRSGGTPAYRFSDQIRARLRARLPYLVDAPRDAKPVVVDLLREQGQVRAADLIELCGLTQMQASRVLTDLRGDGVITVGSQRAVGKGVFYVAGDDFPR